MINNKKKTAENFLTTIFQRILTVFTNLNYLNCHPFFELEKPRLWFGEITPIFFSSTLLELHVNVATLNDCLYLLDGRVNQLRTFYVNIAYFNAPWQMTKDMVGCLRSFE